MHFFVFSKSQEALEQAEQQEERRRSSITPAPSTRNSTSTRLSWLNGSAGGQELDRSAGKGSNGGKKVRASKGGQASDGGGEAMGAVRDEENTEFAYRRALARVRHETVQEGLRQGQVRERLDGLGRQDRWVCRGAGGGGGGCR